MITEDYAPEEFVTNSSRVYQFTFPAADDRSIKVWEIITEDSVDYRYLVPVQDYVLEWNSPSPRYPLKRNGKISFSRKHSLNTTKVMVERNTLIVQTIDFPTQRSFNTRMVEFAMDKATMIIQELAERKCNVSVTITPITQLVEFGSYDDFPAAEVNYAVNKIFTYLQEIDSSADDCTEDLGSA